MRLRAALAALLLAAQPAAAEGAFRLLGVNLAGAEFGVPNQAEGGINRGREGVDYAFPTAAEIDHYAAQNLNAIRLPFSWERVQPAMGGPLDPAQLDRLDALVRHAATRGVHVVLDVHNYGYGYGHLVGSHETPASAFADLWSRLARHYAGQPNVLFGLMNEPHRQTAAEWLPAVNAAIAAIRAAGAGQTVLVPGVGYSNGAAWMERGNAGILAAGVVDPAGNLAFEVHQYLDPDHSGSSAAVASPTVGAERLRDVTAWAERTGIKLFLGEFGAGRDPASLLALRNTLCFMADHRGAWLGGTLWAGGPWWGSYPLSTEPDGDAPAPQAAVLASFMR